MTRCTLGFQPRLFAAKVIPVWIEGKRFDHASHRQSHARAWPADR